MSAPGEVVQEYTPELVAALATDFPLRGELANVPRGGKFLGLFNADPGVGWTRVSALDNTFLRAASSYGASAGGAAAHTHSTPSHSHTLDPNSQSWGQQNPSADDYPQTAGGTRSADQDVETDTDGSGTSGSTSSLPPYSNVLIYSAD